MKATTKQLHGMIEAHVINSIGTGNDSFLEESKNTAENFFSKKRKYGDIIFVGILMKKRYVILHSSNILYKLAKVATNWL